MVIGLPLKGVYRTMRKISWIALGIIILPAISLCTNVPTARADDISNPSSASCSGGGSWQFGLCRTGQQDAAEVYGNDHQPRQTPGQQQPSSNPSTVNDQRAHLTADATAAPEAQRFWNWARCASVSIGTAPNDGHVSDEDCSIPFDPVTGTVTRAPAQLPTTRDLLLAAATIIHADGAGLHKRPEGVSYTNKHIPTLVAATHPTQTHTVTLLGHDITVTLTATSYTWSWGDGTPDLTTTSPGMPWQEGMDPNTDPALIRHYYKAPNGWKSFLDGPYPSATRTITLTTTWAGTATNPFTGDTQTINGLVTTTETTGPFPLGQLIVNNTDTSEEKQGH